MPTKKPTTGRNKLIEERKSTKAANQGRVRRTLVEAGEPLTATEIAQRTGLNPATVSELAAALGLYRRRANHGERGGSLMGANPYLYWTERSVPKRKTPVEGVTPAKVVLAVKPQPPMPKRVNGYEQIKTLPDGRIVLTDDNSDLWVAHRIEV